MMGDERKDASAFPGYELICEQIGLDDARGVLDMKALQSAQVKLVCTREEKAHDYHTRMMAEEDLAATEYLDAAFSAVMASLFNDEAEASITAALLMERPRTPRYEIEFCIGDVVKYSDGKVHIIEDYLDGLAYLKALSFYLYDMFHKGGYKVMAGNQHGGYNAPMRRPGQPMEELDPTREQIVSGMFSRGTNLCQMKVSWGDDAYVDALHRLEDMSQYNAFASGVSMADIMA